MPGGAAVSVCFFGGDGAPVSVNVDRSFAKFGGGGGGGGGGCGGFVSSSPVTGGGGGGGFV